MDFYEDGLSSLHVFNFKVKKVAYIMLIRVNCKVITDYSPFGHVNLGNINVISMFNELR